MTLTSGSLKQSFKSGSIVMINDIIVKHNDVIIKLAKNDKSFAMILRSRLNELRQYSGMKRFYFELEA